MLIDRTGEYRTAKNDTAVVAAIKNDLALGWVEKDGVLEPTSWKVNDGKVWTGGCGDDLVGPWHDPTPPDFKITAPGHYRTRGGERVEVKFLWEGYASGIGPHCPLTWLDNGDHWCWSTGIRGGNRGLDIVAEWREPVTETVTLELCNMQGETFVRMAGNYGSATKVLARRTVTITEGEGMP